MANRCAEPLPSDARTCIHLGCGAMHRRQGEYTTLPVHKPRHSRQNLHPCNHEGVPSPFDVAALTWKPHGRLSEPYSSAAPCMVSIWFLGGRLVVTSVTVGDDDVVLASSLVLSSGLSYLLQAAKFLRRGVKFYFTFRVRSIFLQTT